MRRLLAAGLAATAASAVCLLALGERLTAPVPVAAPRSPRGLEAESVAIPHAAGDVRGWFVPGKQGGGGVLLLHGIRASRQQMQGRAAFLRRAGYASLLIDLPAHGESRGERISFGAREASAVQASMSFLRQKLPGEPIAVIGVSLGAASFVLADVRPRPDAVVLESMYPTIRDAVADRLAIWLGPAGRVLAAPLLWQLPLRLGVAESDLEPIRHLPSLATPVAIAAGTLDRHTPWSETRQLFDAARAPKVLWRFEGLSHVDLHRGAPALYEARVLRFLAEHLHRAAPRE